MNSACMCSVLRQLVGQPSRGRGKGPPRIRRRGAFAPPLVSTRRSPVDDLRRSLDASRRPPTVVIVVRSSIRRVHLRPTPLRRSRTPHSGRRPPPAPASRGRAPPSGQMTHFLPISGRDKCNRRAPTENAVICARQMSTSQSVDRCSTIS